MLHPLYSPDITPLDQHLFKSLQSHLNELRLTSRDNKKRLRLLKLKSYTRNVKMLIERCNKVIENKFRYIDD